MEGFGGEETGTSTITTAIPAPEETGTSAPASEDENEFKPQQQQHR